MSTKIIRACELSGVNYKVGDVVTEYHIAERLTLLGFAEPTTKAEKEQAAAVAAQTADPGKKE